MSDIEELEKEHDYWMEKFLIKHGEYSAFKEVYEEQKKEEDELKEQVRIKTLELQQLTEFIEESKKKDEMFKKLSQIYEILESAAINGNEESAAMAIEELLEDRLGHMYNECTYPGILKEIEALKQEREVTRKAIKELEDKILKYDQSIFKLKKDIHFLENDKTEEVRKMQQENALKKEKLAQMQQEIQTKKNIIAEFNLKYNKVQHTETLPNAGQPENVKQGHFSAMDTQGQQEVPSLAVPALKVPTNVLDTPKIAPQTSVATEAQAKQIIQPPETPQKMEVPPLFNFLTPQPLQRKPIDNSTKISPQSKESLGARPKKIELRRLTDSVGYSAAPHSASIKTLEYEMINKSYADVSVGNRRTSPRLKSFTEDDSKTRSKISQSQESEIARPKKIENRRKTEGMGLKTSAHSAFHKIQEEREKKSSGNFSAGKRHSGPRMKSYTENDTKTPEKPKSKGSEKKVTRTPQLEDVPKKTRSQAATTQESPSMGNKGKQAKAQVMKQDQVPEKKRVEGKKPQPSPTSPQDSFAMGSEFSFNMRDDFGNGSIAGENNDDNFDVDFGGGGFGDDSFGSNDMKDSNSFDFI